VLRSSCRFFLLTNNQHFQVDNSQTGKNEAIRTIIELKATVTSQTNTRVLPPPRTFNPHLSQPPVFITHNPNFPSFTTSIFHLQQPPSPISNCPCLQVHSLKPISCQTAVGRQTTAISTNMHYICITAPPQQPLSTPETTNNVHFGPWILASHSSSPPSGGGNLSLQVFPQICVDKTTNEAPTTTAAWQPKASAGPLW